jgi:co-chaperonin GroES (HSP10)
MQTKFFNAFQKLRETGKDLYKLRGNQLLIELVEEDVKASKTSSIIIAEDVRQVHGGAKENAGLVGIVLDRGEGYYDEDTGETVELDVKVGDVVLVPKYAISQYSTFPGIIGPVYNKIALCVESEIKMYYKGQDAYEKAKGILNE